VRKVCALSAVVAAGLFALSCGGPSGETGGGGESPGEGGGRSAASLQIISPHWQGIEEEFGPAFERHWREKTGEEIEVVWRDMGGTSDDLRWIKSEFEKRPSGIDIDLFFGGGIDPYRQLKALGVLEKHTVPGEILSGVPAELHGVGLYDPDHTWYGTAVSGFGIIYNRLLLDRLDLDPPQDWEDLADPELFSYVGAGDPRHSGTVHMMYEIILQAYGWERGWEIITGVAANTRTLVSNSGDIPRSVATGEIAAGTAIDFYAWTQVEQAGRERVGFVLPKDATVVNPDSIAVLKGAPHPEAAKEFVNFVLSEAGQKLWYLRARAPGGPAKYDLFRMPVRPEIYEKYSELSPVVMDPFEGEVRGFGYDSKLGTARYEGLNDLVGATIVDCHGGLVKAWKGLIGAGLASEKLGALSEPPVSEEELTRLSKEKLTDPIERNRLIAEWVTFAKEKYSRLAP